MNDPARSAAKELVISLEGAAAAHAVLLSSVDALTDDTLRRASLLPNWSVAHVLAHLARNADSHTRLLLGAVRGEVLDQYIGGAEGRAADIDASAEQPAFDLLADLRRSIDDLQQAWLTAASTEWAGQARLATGQTVRITELPLRRWREVVVHQHDLGLGYSWADWPADYVRLDLRVFTMQWASRKPMGFDDMPQAAIAVSERQRLAWLLGRSEIAGLDPAGLMA